METLQLLNTAIVRRQQKLISSNFEERLRSLKDSPALDVLQKAIIQLSDQQHITRDQAAQMVVDSIFELNGVWQEYIAVEGIDRLKATLGN